MLLCLATALFAPQLDCGPRSSIPDTIFDASAFEPATHDFGQLELEGDILVASRPFEPLASGGDGVIYLHRREPGGEWLAPHRLEPQDLGGTDFSGFGHYADYAVGGGSVFIPIRVSTGWNISVVEYAGGSWIEVAQLEGEPGWQYSTSFQQTGYGDNAWVAADSDRLVVGAPNVTLPGGELGAIVTYERTANGQFQIVSITENMGAFRGGVRLDDLKGDRLALIQRVPASTYGLESRAAVLEHGAAGWVPKWLSEPLDSYSSLSLDSSRVLVGTFYGALTEVYDAASSTDLTSGAPIQIIEPDRIASSPPESSSAPADYNPPYDAYVEAEEGFAVIGVRDNFFGYPTVRTLEWFDGSYRLVRSTRAPAGAADVNLDRGEAVWLGPSRTFSSDQVAARQFETWRIDDGRAVPYCPGSADLLLSGSGAAPFDAGFVTAYGIEPASVVLLFGGLAMGTTVLGTGEQLCIDANTLVGLGAPLQVGEQGSVRVQTSALELEGLAPALIAGGTFFIQGVYREPTTSGGNTGITNAVRTILCQ